MVERVTPIGEELLAVRRAFLSRHAHRTFLRYAEAQFRKLDADLRKAAPAGGTPYWKHVMHMLRLLESGLHLVRRRDARGRRRRPAQERGLVSAAPTCRRAVHDLVVRTHWAEPWGASPACHRLYRRFRDTTTEGVRDVSEVVA